MLTASAFFCAGVPSLVDDLPPAMEAAVELSHQAIDSSLFRMQELERSRAAGWMSPGEFAYRVRHDVMPSIALSQMSLSQYGANELIFSLDRKVLELETVALVFEAKDRLIEAEKLTRKSRFIESTAILDEYWISVLPTFEKLRPKLATHSTELADALARDFERFSRLAFRLETLIVERHLASVKAEAFAPDRLPAQIDLSDPSFFTKVLLGRDRFLTNVHPQGDASNLRAKLEKIDAIYGDNHLDEP